MRRQGITLGFEIKAGDGRVIRTESVRMLVPRHTPLDEVIAEAGHSIRGRVEEDLRRGGARFTPGQVASLREYGFEVTLSLTATAAAESVRRSIQQIQSLVRGIR